VEALTAAAQALHAQTPVVEAQALPAAAEAAVAVPAVAQHMLPADTLPVAVVDTMASK